MNNTVVKVQNVSKKFCRNLRLSLRYGLCDILSELNPFRGQGRGFGARASGCSHDLRTPQIAGVKSSLRPSEFWAVDDVSFEVRRGECLGLIGRNGAGKTTLLKMLNGLIKPDCGRIEMRGRVGGLIALGAGFNPILSGRENIYINASVLGMKKRDTAQMIEQIIDFAAIREFIDAPVQTYSSGMHVRLGFACAISVRSDVLLIDEVLAVGDVGFRMKCYKHILSAKERGVAMILVSHNMVDIHRVCDRVVVLSNGKAVFEGDSGSGARAYEQLLLGQQSQSQGQLSRGDGPRLTNPRLEDLEGRERSEFLTGDSMRLRVDIQAQRPWTDLRVIVHIVSATVGPLGSFASPSSGVWFDIFPPGKTIDVILRKVPLLMGVYGIYLTLYGKEVDSFYHHLIPAVSFSIVGPKCDPFGFGWYHNVQFHHEWMEEDKYANGN